LTEKEMRIGGPERGWGVIIGRDYWRDARLHVVICWGHLPEAKLGETSWRHWWEVSTVDLSFVFYRGRHFIYPCGIQLFGRYFLLPFHWRRS
jgi:hypothetical protein